MSNTPKTMLRPTDFPHVFEDVSGGSEPLFLRTIERGEVQFWHQTGYGYLPESRIEVVGIAGVTGTDGGQQR